MSRSQLDVRALLAACLLAGPWCLAVDAGSVEINVTGEDGKPLPCRIQLTGSDGKPVWDDALATAVKSVSRGTEGDGKAPMFKDHFVCGGKATLELPAGEYGIEIVRGPEYAPFTSKFTVAESGEQTVAARLSRIADMAKEGWWSGELNVPRSQGDVPLLMMAEDLHVVPVITWRNDRNQWKDRELPKDPVKQFDGDRFCDVMGGEDKREGGALLYYGLKEPLPILGSKREYPSPMTFVNMAHEKPGAWIDIENPFWWDVPIWVSSGKVQSMQIATNHMNPNSTSSNEEWGRPRDGKKWPNPRGHGLWSQHIYHQLLNCGLRISPSAGSGSGLFLNPVGFNRMYVHVDGKLTYAGWWDGLRQGRVLVTNGPLLRVTANGELPGHVFSTNDKTGIDFDLKALLDSDEPISNVEIMVNGEVQRTVPFEEVKKSKSLGKLHFSDSGWFLVRAITDKRNALHFASTGPFYVEVGDVKRRISRQSANYFVDWVQQRMPKVKLNDAAQKAEVMAFHEAALKYWQDLAARANAD